MAAPRTVARIVGHPFPGVCGRYLANGLRCTNPTDHADGWCRSEGCPGYTTPTPERARFEQVRPHHRVPVNPRPCPLDSYDIATLGMARSAIDAFRDAHRGFDRAQAEACIRTMIEDFAAMGRWSRGGEGWLRLAFRGYYVTITPDLADVVRYGTRHAERTWPQVKAGVPSRGARERRRRQHLRRAERRHAALVAAGATAAYVRVAEGERRLTVTASDGRSMYLGTRSLGFLSAGEWRELVARAESDLGIGLLLPGSGDFEDADEERR